jgi:hypothetical protein
MVVFSILSVLFKKRMAFAQILNDKGEIEHEWEFVLKILKPVLWYCIISIAYSSAQQPIDGAKFGFDASWPLDSLWFCIDKMCDLARTALQYRMSIKWR